MYQAISPGAKATLYALPDTAQADFATLITAHADEYPNNNSRRQKLAHLNRLAQDSGCSHPQQLTTTSIIKWATSGDPANNTVYQRLSCVRTFLTWCVQEGHTDTNIAAGLHKSGPLRSYRRTYGKVQSKYPGRWLTHDQAFHQLVGACQDGTLQGLRDEIIIRLGLLGMRRAEILNLRLRNIQQLPTITWTGKGRKPRKATAHPALVKALNKYLKAYEDPTTDAPVICRMKLGGPPRQRQIAWGTSLGDTSLTDAIHNRAAKAGLGHVAPHDLRRSAAGILHNATNEDGAHFFDLLDIQKVLGHSDPAVTMRSYLEPMDTDVLDRAASILG